MRTRPSCFQPVHFDPAGPMRDPRSRRSVGDCTADMAGVMEEIYRHSADSTVTKDDLHRAGFTVGEIDACHGAASAELTKRLGRHRLPVAA